MRKLVVALACRNQGSRLYGKPLQNLDIDKGFTILDNIIACLSRLQCIDSIVLGIAEGSTERAFVDYARSNGVGYIVGDEIDVLSRLIQCGEHVGATDIFRTTSESPFPFFEAIESSWLEHCKKENDATFLDEIIDGCGFEIIKLDALKESHHKGQRRHRSELCTLFIREHANVFKIQRLSPPKELIRKDLRLTVDYPEDLIVCRSVYKTFKKDAPMIPLRDVVRFIDDNEFLKNLIAPFCKFGYSTMYLG
jgi:spore coat polysaccharide biosynthesis protein SpsF